MRTILTFLLALTILHGQAQKQPTSNSKSGRGPNVVFILMDDMGYGDIGPTGGFPYHTPNLDKLAAEGMRFTNFYAAQGVCSASRAAYMTGCYPNRIGISGALFHFSSIALNPDEETLPELLKEKGYATGMVGKWHLGCKPPYLPLQNGFQEYLGLPYSNDMWPVNYDGSKLTDTNNFRSKFVPLPLIDGNSTTRIISTLDDQAELTGMYTRRATEFIHKNSKKPFFLYVAHSMPHVPIAASKDFRGKSGAGLYGDVMQEIDASVGSILKALEQEGLTNNTLVIFTSDNGPWLSFGDHAGSSGGLREGKGTAWEGGVRVPMIMKYPGHIQAGAICNQVATGMDILPTVVGVCGARLPVKKIDGMDLRALFSSDNKIIVRDEFAYYYDVNSLKAIRKGQWKLVLPHNSQTYKNPGAIGGNGYPGKTGNVPVPKALYDLRTDPGETYDLQDRFPEIVAQLEKIAEKYREELGDDLTKRVGKGVRPAAVVK